MTAQEAFYALLDQRNHINELLTEAFNMALLELAKGKDVYIDPDLPRILSNAPDGWFSVVYVDPDEDNLEVKDYLTWFLNQHRDIAVFWAIAGYMAKTKGE